MKRFYLADSMISKSGTFLKSFIAGSVRGAAIATIVACLVINLVANVGHGQSASALQTPVKHEVPRINPVSKQVAPDPVVIGSTDYLYVGSYQFATTTSMSATLMQAKPIVAASDAHSLAELAAESADGNQIVEVGWTVDQSVNGDSLPHLFIYHWVNGVGACYNGCGFVQVSGTTTPGMAVTSGVTGQYQIVHASSQWQIFYNGAEVGYFPDSLWSGTYTQIGLSQFFGEVAATRVQPCTEMGNGLFGTLANSATISGITLASTTTALTMYASTASLYNYGLVQSNSFRFGGPGNCGPGYYLLGSDGGVFPFGDAAGYGSTGNIHLAKPMVNMATTPDGAGYWLVASDGGVFPFGDANGYGSTGNIRLNQPVVGMASTPSGHGYWLVAADGGIFPFGDAGGYGSTGNIRLNQPVVGMAATPDGNGYWLVAADGGIFPFGDAGGYGSTGNVHLRKPIVGMASTPSGHGYWLVAADGGIFPFGDAGGYGSAGNLNLDKPIVGITATIDGKGYWLVGADGGIFTYGDAGYYGSLAGGKVDFHIVGIAN